MEDTLFDLGQVPPITVLSTALHGFNSHVSQTVAFAFIITGAGNMAQSHR